MTRIVSGIQPTGSGRPHLGNYLGALRAFAGHALLGESFFFIADLHATTVAFDPNTLSNAIHTTAATLLACGVDPDRSAVFQQSKVSAHAELFVLLAHMASLGPLERMTQFKEKGRVSQGTTRDSIPFGLLSYPVLMAADILVYDADCVPVGHDQRQHLQLAQELAQRVNHRFGTDTLIEPRAHVQPIAARVMDLRTPLSKMSKSRPEGCLFLDDPLDVAVKKIRQATSDSLFLPSEFQGLSERPAAQSLVTMLAALEGISPDKVCDELANQGFAALKARLCTAYDAVVAPIRARMLDLDSPDGRLYVQSVLDKGAMRARDASAPVVARVQARMGF